MTMMIMRFNKLIQSKLIWYFILGVIVVSFVLWGALSDAGGPDFASSRSDAAIAHWRGEPILSSEYNRTRNLMDTFSNETLDPEKKEDLILERIATVRYAESLGLYVPESELNQIVGRQFVDDKGVYSDEFRRNYEAYLAREKGLTLADMREYFRQQVLIELLNRTMASHALVPEYDVTRWGRQQTDRFVVDYCEVPRERVSTNVVVTESNLVTFFEKHREDFGLPERRTVQYVRFAIPETVPTNAVTSAEIEAYYQSNLAAYTTEIPVGGDNTNLVPVTSVTPLSDVEEEIRERLGRAVVRKNTLNEAMTFSVLLRPRRGRQPPELSELAAREGLEVRKAGPFDARAFLEEVENEQVFVSTAFRLDQTPFGRVGEPVEGGTEIYVMVLDSIEAPRLPELDEARFAVAVAATNYYTDVELDTYSSNLVTELQAQLDEQALFPAAAEAMGLVVTSTPPFQLKELTPYSITFPPSVASEANYLVEGKVSRPLPGYMGNRVIAFLRSREEVPEDAAAISGDIRNELMQMSMRGLVPTWRESVLLKELQKVESSEGAGGA